MHNQEQGSFFDLFKDRPLIFTFVWAFCLLNWKSIWWFLAEPLKFSIKLNTYEELGFGFYICSPIVLTILATIFYPLAVHIPNFFKEYWQKKYDSFKANREPAKFIPIEKYEKLDKQFQDESQKATSAIKETLEYREDSSKKQSQIDKLKITEKQQLDEINKLTEQNQKIKDDLLNSNQQFEEMSEKFSSSAEEHLTLTKTLQQYKEQAEKIEDKYQTLLDRNYKLKQKHLSLRHEVSMRTHKENTKFELDINRKNEISSKFPDEKPKYFVENFNQIMGTPFIGITIDDCLYLAGKVIYIPQTYKEKGIFFSIIKEEGNEKLKYGIRYPSSVRIIEVPEDGMLIDYQNLDDNNNEFLELVTFWTENPNSATDVYKIEYSNEINKYLIKL
ncbi:hypothetical protein JFJ09_00715 [Pseudoalteromonas arctica]|uniref:hypothetical protein n=1 Tax=Pseudoalteromonas arctica TaxID=394751 RepID=UPI001C9BC9FB|nr:hypothetical protein [Pseudoalteromonas arctica]MBZ2190730.1 hypothetical protein [Pseudoalteromonas arctica]